VNVPTNVTNQTNNWLRQRLVAVAASMIGYGYRHHHIPDWNPDQSWYDKAPGLVSPMPLNTLIGQGIDCSDYTAWLYNYGLGIHLTTSVAQQANMTSVQDSTGYTYNVKRVADATLSFAQLLQTLDTGDLLFIAGNPTVSKADIQNQLSNPANLQITHVIMWLGKNGIANNVPLVTDSHGAGMLDANGITIPGGVQLRPFNNTTFPITTATKESSPAWYFEHFAWALRVLPD